MRNKPTLNNINKIEYGTRGLRKILYKLINDRENLVLTSKYYENNSKYIDFIKSKQNITIMLIKEFLNVYDFNLSDWEKYILENCTISDYQLILKKMNVPYSEKDYTIFLLKRKELCKYFKLFFTVMGVIPNITYKVSTINYNYYRIDFVNTEEATDKLLTQICNIINFYIKYNKAETKIKREKYFYFIHDLAHLYLVKNPIENLKNGVINGIDLNKINLQNLRYF